MPEGLLEGVASSILPCVVKPKSPMRFMSQPRRKDIDSMRRCCTVAPLSDVDRTLRPLRLVSNMPSFAGATVVAGA